MSPRVSLSKFTNLPSTSSYILSKSDMELTLFTFKSRHIIFLYIVAACQTLIRRLVGQVDEFCFFLLKIKWCLFSRLPPNIALLSWKKVYGMCWVRRRWIARNRIELLYLWHRMHLILGYAYDSTSFKLI